jgi:methionine biosynthesis protein MetW
MAKNQIIFENNRWDADDQPFVYRHEAALELLEGKKILDFGCGNGFFMALMKKKGHEVYGVDISDVGIGKCKKKGLDNVYVIDGEKTEFEDKSFDEVVILDVLEHVYTPNIILREAARLSDTIIFGVPNFNSLPARLQMLFGNAPENNRPKKGHIYWFNYKIILDLLQKEGLEIIQLKTNTFWETKPVFKFIMKKLKVLHPNLFALSLIVKCRVKK